MTRLTVIEGTPAPDTPQERLRERLRKSPKPAEMLQCHRCGGREMMETKLGMMLKDGKATGGTKQILCVGCLLRGERVVVF